MANIKFKKGIIEKLEKTLRCPSCYKEVQMENEKVYCSNCNVTYPIRGEVIDFLAHKEDYKEQTWYYSHSVTLYDFWRKSRFMKLFTGVTFEDETQILNQLYIPQQDDTALDVACGPAIFTREIAKQTRSLVVGLDISLKVLLQGKKLAKKQYLENIAYIRGDALGLPFKDESFDFINCCSSIHLFPDQQKFFNEAYRVLRKGGIIRGENYIIPGCNLIQRYVLKWAEIRGAKYYSYKKFVELISETGFKNIDDEVREITIFFKAKK